MFSKPLLPHSTPAPAREAQILPDNKSNQHLVKKLMGTTKSHLCHIVFAVTTASSTGLLKVKIFSRMKEKNINSPTAAMDAAAAAAAAAALNKKSDDENFELVSTPPTTPTAATVTKTTIFEKAGMKLKMATPVTSPSTLASPTVTITPATPASSLSLLADKTKTSQGIPGVVIG